MAFRKGFFTSTTWTVNGDGFAVGNNAEGSDFFAKIIGIAVGNGVPYLPSSNLQCTVSSGMNMTVGAGYGFKVDANGGAYMAWETTDATISFTTSASEQTFYISARLDLASNEFTGSKYDKYTTFVAATDLCVAKIVIPANAIAITNAMITDLRGNYTYCGYITDKREELDALIVDLQEQIANIIGGGMPDHASTHAATGDDPIDIDACNGVMYTEQTLSAGEKTQVLSNIGAAAATHKSNHAYGGSDALAASDIGQYGVTALDANGKIASGQENLIYTVHTANLILAAADADHKLHRMSGAGLTVTINSGVFPVGTIIPFVTLLPTDTVAFIAGSGVTIVPIGGYTHVSGVASPVLLHVAYENYILAGCNT